MMAQYDRAFLRRETTKTLLARTHKNLVSQIGTTELVNHISTSFWASQALLGLDVELIPGKSSPVVQAAMQAIGINQLIGFTPLFPRSNPICGDWRLVEECERLMTHQGLRYLKARGKALDFPGGDGCFILVGASLSQAESVLSDQLSCIVLPSVGVAKLTSLID